jgi:hypothetical protein
LKLPERRLRSAAEDPVHRPRIKAGVTKLVLNSSGLLTVKRLISNLVPRSLLSLGNRRVRGFKQWDRPRAAGVQSNVSSFGSSTCNSVHRARIKTDLAQTGLEPANVSTR